MESFDFSISSISSRSETVRAIAVISAERLSAISFRWLSSNFDSLFLILRLLMGILLSG